MNCWLYKGRKDDASLGKKCDTLEYQKGDKLYDLVSNTMAIIDVPRRDPLLFFVYAVRTAADLYVYQTGDRRILRIIPNFFQVFLVVKYINPTDKLLWLTLGSFAKVVQEYVIHGKDHRSKN